MFIKLLLRLGKSVSVCVIWEGVRCCNLRRNLDDRLLLALCLLHALSLSLWLSFSMSLSDSLFLIQTHFFTGTHYYNKESQYLTSTGQKTRTRTHTILKKQHIASRLNQMFLKFSRTAKFFSLLSGLINWCCQLFGLQNIKDKEACLFQRTSWCLNSPKPQNDQFTMTLDKQRQQTFTINKKMFVFYSWQLLINSLLN